MTPQNESKKHFIEHSFVVESWFLSTPICRASLLYLISIQLHLHFAEHLQPCASDSRFVEVESLEITIHDNVYKSVRFRAIAGLGYKLPRIMHYHSPGGQDDCTAGQGYSTMDASVQEDTITAGHCADT